MLQSMRSAAKYIWIFIVIVFVGVFLFTETSGLLNGGRVYAAATSDVQCGQRRAAFGMSMAQ